MVGKEIGGGIEGGDGSTITRRRFACDGPAVGNVAIIHTRIPEAIALRGKSLIQLRQVGRKRKGERGIEACCPDMPALVAIVDVSAHQGVGGDVLLRDFLQGAMQSGILAGYNVVDVKVTLNGGSYHEVDSSEMAFKIAGSMAFKNAMRKASPILTEPIMKVVVITPDDYLGDVIGDINSRRGNIQSMDPLNGATQITASVPLSNMFGYATDLRSKTQGRGQYSMEPSHFAQVPKNIAEEIMAGRKSGN